MKRIIHVEGMSCGHCAKRVENALNDITGVSAKVNLDEKIATVSLEKDVDDIILTQAVENAGYKVESIHVENQE